MLETGVEIRDDFRGAMNSPGAEWDSAMGRARQVERIRDGTELALYIDSAWMQNRAYTDAEEKEELAGCFNDQAHAKGYCELPQDVRNHITNHRDDPFERKIRATHKFVNNWIEYASDEAVFQHYKKHDFRATGVPGDAENEVFQTMGVAMLIGHGDCDDYVVSKYDMLKRTGVPEDRMLILYGFSKARVPLDENGKMNPEWESYVQEAELFKIEDKDIWYGGHAVLAVKDDSGRIFILNQADAGDDNGDIYEANRYQNHFVPLYGVNGNTKIIFEGEEQEKLRNKFRSKNPVSAAPDSTEENVGVSSQPALATHLVP